jgi:hypothetical protein
MKQPLNYGRISWSYDDFDTKVPCRPTPLIIFNPIRIKGKLKHPVFSDKISLELLKYKTPMKLLFGEAYKEWRLTNSWLDRDLGEGRAFFRWLLRHGNSIDWRPQDFKLHDYFTGPNSPKHDPHDEMAKDLSFAVRPVKVKNRQVKLYLQDEAVLNLISLPFGEEKDFIELVQEYISMRFQWQEWNAPAPLFLDWVKVRGKRPIFSEGQLGFSLV